MYPLRLLKIVERYSGKSNADKHERRNREEGIVIMRINLQENY